MWCLWSPYQSRGIEGWRKGLSQTAHFDLAWTSRHCQYDVLVFSLSRILWVGFFFKKFILYFLQVTHSHNKPLFNKSVFKETSSWFSTTLRYRDPVKFLCSSLHTGFLNKKLLKCCLLRLVWILRYLLGERHTNGANFSRRRSHKVA